MVVTCWYDFPPGVTAVTPIAAASGWLIARRRSPSSAVVGGVRNQPGRGACEAAARIPGDTLPGASRACDSISPVVRSGEQAAAEYRRPEARSNRPIGLGGRPSAGRVGGSRRGRCPSEQGEAKQCRLETDCAAWRWSWQWRLALARRWPASRHRGKWIFNRPRRRSWTGSSNSIS